MKKWILLLVLIATTTHAQEQLAAAAQDTIPGGSVVVTTAPASMPATRPDATTGPSTQTLTATTAAVSPATTTASSQPGAPKDRFARVSPPARSIAAAKTMPKDYSLLVSRSVFVHGRMPDPRTPEPPGVPIPAPRPEKSLLFNGATKADGELVAFIEDMTAGKVLKLRVGDSVARGKIAAITLDTFDYDSGGKVRQIVLGQNLDGEAGLPASRPTTSSSSPGSSTPGGSPLTDILERLRQKRAQELGGK